MCYLSQVTDNNHVFCDALSAECQPYQCRHYLYDSKHTSGKCGTSLCCRVVPVSFQQGLSFCCKLSYKINVTSLGKQGVISTAGKTGLNIVLFSYRDRLRTTSNVVSEILGIGMTHSLVRKDLARMDRDASLNQPTMDYKHGNTEV